MPIAVSTAEGTYSQVMGIMGLQFMLTIFIDATPGALFFQVHVCSLHTNKSRLDGWTSPGQDGFPNSDVVLVSTPGSSQPDSYSMDSTVPDLTVWQTHHITNSSSELFRLVNIL